MATEAVARRGDGGRPSAGWSGGTRQTRQKQTHRPTRAVFFAFWRESPVFSLEQQNHQVESAIDRSSHRPLDTGLPSSRHEEPSTARVVAPSTAQQLRSSRPAPSFSHQVELAIDRSSHRLTMGPNRRPVDSSSHRPFEPSSRPVPSFCRRVKSTLNARAIDLERSSHRAIEPSSRPGTAHESTQFIKSSSDQSRWATQPPRTRVRESRLRRLLWFTRVSSTTTVNVMCA